MTRLSEIVSPDTLRLAWDARELAYGEASAMALALLDHYSVDEVLIALPTQLAHHVVDYGMREALATDPTRISRGIEIPRTAVAEERLREWLRTHEPRYVQMERWRRLWAEIATLGVRLAGWETPGLDAWKDDTWLFGAASESDGRAIRVVQGEGSPVILGREQRELVLHVGQEPDAPFALRPVVESWVHYGVLEVQRHAPPSPTSIAA